MKVGLFFGSFNPIHIGHLIIANHILEYAQIDHIWFVVSPQSPFKTRTSLLGEFDRLHLVESAIVNDSRMRSCNIEFTLSKPSYTIDTLVCLREKYPTYNFSLIMGSDNLESFHKWKNYESILKQYEILVYNRAKEIKTSLANHNSVHIYDAPILKISSSYIRECIKNNKSIKYLVPEEVINQIEASSYYK